MGEKVDSSMVSAVLCNEKEEEENDDEKDKQGNIR